MSVRADKVHLLNNLFNGAKKPLSKAYLTRKTGIPEASLDRHFFDLRTKFNAPLKWSVSPKGYYYEKDGDAPFELPGIWLTKDELASIFVLRQLVKDMPEGALSKTMDTLWGRIEKVSWSEGQLPRQGWAEKVKILPIGGRTVEDNIFRIVVEGLVQGRQLEVEYKGLGKPSSTRMISPLQIVRYRDNWYVDNWCHKAGGLRSFAMSRILQARITKEKVEKVDPKELAKIFGTSYGIFNGSADNEARIRFKGIAVEEVPKESWHPKQRGQFVSPNLFELVVPYHDDRELIMDILRWGELAEVVEPLELRAKIKNRLKAALKSY